MQLVIWPHIRVIWRNQPVSSLENGSKLHAVFSKTRHIKKKYKIEKSHEKNRDERAEEDNTISSVGVIEWWCKPDYI